MQDRHRARIRAAMERRGLTCKDVATYAGVHERTVQRFVEGETFSLETLARVEAALRIPAEEEGPVKDSGAEIRRIVPDATYRGPVMGWKQAANALQMHRDTLLEHRRRHRDGTVVPWWRSVEALHRWYLRMIGQEVDIAEPR